MGTNYYLHTDGKEKHIGKSSGGWHFSLHVIPEEGINTLDDWVELIKSSEGQIKDEYGQDVTLSELLFEITNRSWLQSWDEKTWEVSKFQPYCSEAHFHALNYSERGLNNLCRHALGYHCIGHGPGTYDYIVGDFS